MAGASDLPGGERTWRSVDKLAVRGPAAERSDVELLPRRPTFRAGACGGRHQRRHPSPAKEVAAGSRQGRAEGRCRGAVMLPIRPVTTDAGACCIGFHGGGGGSYPGGSGALDRRPHHAAVDLLTSAPRPAAVARYLWPGLCHIWPVSNIDVVLQRAAEADQLAEAASVSSPGATSSLDLRHDPRRRPDCTRLARQVVRRLLEEVCSWRCGTMFTAAASGKVVVPEAESGGLTSSVSSSRTNLRYGVSCDVRWLEMSRS